MARIGIISFSPHGATHELATVLADGVAQAGGQAHLRRAPEPTGPDDADDVGEDDEREHVAADEPASVPAVSIEELPRFDGLLIGAPTHDADAITHLQGFFDRTSELWVEGKLVGKPVGFFTGAAASPAELETTVLAMSTFAYRHGMLVVPVDRGSLRDTGPTRGGGSPHGVTALTPMGDDHGIDERERELALQHAAQVHHVAAKLVPA